MERKKRKEVSAIQGTDLALEGVLSNMAAQLKEMKEQMAPGKLERIPGNKNRADGLSRIEWVQPGEAKEETSPVDGFLKKYDMQLHVNVWALRVEDNEVREGKPMWFAPATFVRNEKLILKPFVEEDPWEERNAEWMAELALAESYRLTEEPVTIEAGTGRVDRHLLAVGRVHYLVNSLLQVRTEEERRTVKADKVILGDDYEFDEEKEGEEFEQGEISEDFREEEYDGFHLEMGLLLSGDKPERKVDAPWSEKIEGMLLIESIRGSKLRPDLDKLIRLHELLRNDCEWLLEVEAEIAEKLEGARRSQRGNDNDGKMEASIRGLQERVKEKEELLTQGVASHIPEILREIQRLRKREEIRDAQVEKMGKEVESMRAEMSKVREEQQKLKMQVESLNIALDSKNKEVEKKRVEREKLEKEVGKLEGEVNKQEKEMETLRKVSQEGGAEIPTKIVEWNDEFGFEIMNITGIIHASGQDPGGVSREALRQRGENNDQPTIIPASANKLVEILTSNTVTKSSNGGESRDEKKRPCSEMVEAGGEKETAIPCHSAKKTRSEGIKLCWYFMKGMHLTEECPGFQFDEEKGLIKLDENKKLIDRVGNVVKKAKDGFRAQLYRQLSLSMVD
ncbi:hypothetical protein CBR_g65652 [Chara braunii]|uniref:Uncharacterized protein n=1 Tax=Chara braunii TaxID=69332 RepID=A0A388MFM0_CHABU|nr:hypothetical protein CBR_g65652 [Chara braunii]|eukprot:GBG93344.1 hypothetical protein CBR_g65652 [Chara braunii]